MFIKTLTIHGFKSYRDQTAIEPFSSSHNVVVGRNGSGKSNFFAAIRFVLSDAYTSMSREDRQSLLHEGLSTSTTLSAYVEIVFSNEDFRFPTGKEEVTLRRTIGLKKDEYSVDRKSSSKAEVMNLLESAGFSKSNPYYIVPQGRITFLTNAKDKERLDLLKEVAGTTLYDEKKAESLKTLENAESKRAKMAKTLEAVDARLEELEEEKGELKEFQEKDRERKALEYSIYTNELEEIGEILGKMEEERANSLDNSNTRRKEFVEREKTIQELENQISSHKQELSLLTVTSEQSEKELLDLIRARTEVNCLIDDLATTSGETSERKEQLEGELETIDQRITQLRAELAEVEPEWRARVKEEKEGRQALEKAKAKLETLYAKQSRVTQFRTQQERDEFLRSELDNIQRFSEEQGLRAEEMEQKLTEAQGRLEEVGGEVEKTRGELEEKKEEWKELQVEHGELKENEGKITDQRKELWREDAKLENTVSHAREELKTAERHLSSMMDRDTASGLRNLDRIVEALNLDGVYGPLYSLFEVDEKYSLAVEETAGNSLFHVVVDTDTTASKIVEMMNSEKAGRLTFVPLNRIRVTPHTYPQTSEVTPLIRKLRFQPEHTKAFEQVFGSTVVVHDLHIATAYRRSHGLNVITLDGDRADRKGALTGGYHDLRRSRLEGIKVERQWRTKFETDSARLTEVKQSISRLEQEITRIVGKLQVVESKRKQAQQTREKLRGELTWSSREEEELKNTIDRLESSRDEALQDVTTLEAKKEAYEAELTTRMSSGLSGDEERQVETLSREVENMQREVSEKTEGRTEVTSRKDALEIELNEGLIRRRDGLRAQLDTLGSIENGDELDGGNDIDSRRREAESLKQTIDNLEAQIKNNEEKKDELETEIQTSASQLEKIQTEQVEDGRGIARSQKVVERYITKRQTLLERKDDCTKLIRDLGVLPEEAFERYINVESSKLLKRLHKTKTALGKFSHVNKKALQMYEKYSKQRDDIYSRFEGMEKSAESIHKLIESLDRKKDAAIENTFAEVSRHFEEIFEKLVPSGRGRLVMNKRTDNQDDDDADSGDERRRSVIDSYTGVSIKVSFNSKVDEGLRIQQLSGGQKALVALALVFAIQRGDPAPFYLFDEIDANLDAQYRSSVAQMIHELSANAQFITTTFRPEMIAQADKCYGVFFNNEKVSSIRSISKENANEFVDHQLETA